MTESIALIVSLLALGLSIVTAWLALFHRGRVQMTTPSMVAFAYDTHAPAASDPKVMVRCLLFSTAERGHVIECLFARLTHRGNRVTFSTWGVHQDKLDLGGGMYVGKQGATAWHHFVAPSARSTFQFQPGTYLLEVFARVHGQKRPLKVWSAELLLPPSKSLSRHDGAEQVWFDREPESGTFNPRLESRGSTSAVLAN